jgi:hypothetical protein
MSASNTAFLSRLVKEAVEYGWEGDYTEVYSFVAAVHEKYGVATPDLLMNPCRDDYKD